MPLEPYEVHLGDPDDEDADTEVYHYCPGCQGLLKHRNYGAGDHPKYKLRTTKNVNNDANSTDSDDSDEQSPYQRMRVQGHGV